MHKIIRRKERAAVNMTTQLLNFDKYLIGRKHDSVIIDIGNLVVKNKRFFTSFNTFDKLTGKSERQLKKKSVLTNTKQWNFLTSILIQLVIR